MLRPRVHKFSKIYEPAEHSTRQQCDMQKGPYRRSTNISRHCTVFSRHGDLTAGICAPFVKTSGFASTPYLCSHTVYTYVCSRHCVIHIHTEIHMPRSVRFVIRATKPKAEDTFRTAAILSIHILQNINFVTVVNFS